MTVRRPIVYDAGPANTSGTFRELTDAELLEWQTAMIDHYAANPTSTLSVVSNSGNISPTMSDTRLQAGAAKTGSDGFVASFNLVNRK